jgi:hypothetical protein
MPNFSNLSFMGKKVSTSAEGHIPPTIIETNDMMEGSTMATTTTTTSDSTTTTATSSQSSFTSGLSTVKSHIPSWLLGKSAAATDPTGDPSSSATPPLAIPDPKEKKKREKGNKKQLKFLVKYSISHK